MTGGMAVRALTETRLAELAAILWEAQRARAPCEPLTAAEPELSLDDGYRVQAANLARKLASERPVRLVGHKIGLTSAAVQRQLGVAQPDFGSLTDDMLVPDGAEADHARLLQPRAEGEIAFVLARTLQGPGVTPAAALAATDFVLPAIEVADSRVRDWQIRAADTIADNASAGLFVLGGRPVRPTDLDMRLAGLALRINGDVVATGAGAACLGHPANAVAWLANALGERGIALAAGQIVLSGALCPLQPVLPGDHVEVRISRLGTASFRFAGPEV